MLLTHTPPALDDEAAGGVAGGGFHFQAGGGGQGAEFGQAPVAASYQHHHQKRRIGRVVRSHSAQDDYTAGGMRGVGTAAQNGSGFAIRPVLQLSLIHI